MMSTNNVHHRNVIKPQMLRHDQQEQENAVKDGRAPVAVSEKINGGMRKAKNREITSRYKAASTPSTPAPSAAVAAQAAAAQAAAARRHPSPNLGRSLSGDSSLPKRALSAERRRPWPAVSPEPKIPAVAGEGASSGAKARLSGRGSEILWPSSQLKQGESSNGLANENAETRSEGAEDERTPISKNSLRPGPNGSQKPTDSSGAPPQRKGSPMRRQSTDQTENARSVDHVRTKPELHRWPSISNGKVFGSAMTRSMDLSAERERPTNNRSTTLTSSGYGTSRPVTSSGYGNSSGYGGSSAARPIRPTASSLIASARNFSRSVNEGPPVPISTPGSRSSTPEQRGRNRVAVETTPKIMVQDIAKSLPESASHREITALARHSSQETVLARSDSQTLAGDTISDSESVSSGGSVAGSRTSSRGTTIPARVWQAAEASRSRRLSEGNRVRSSLSEQDLSAAAKAAKAKVGALGTSPGTNASNSAWSLSSARGITPITSSQPPLSPSARGRGGSSPLRGLPSPTRTRPSSSNASAASRIPSITSLNFGTDMRSRGKKAMSQQEEALLLRILHNRYLQWRFVNAWAETALNSQRAAAEKSMYSVWIKTSELRASVASQRMKLQQARHFKKLKTILSLQAPQLQAWSALKQDHSSALLGVVEALEASILRVPVTGGARADVQAVKEALGSAVDVMNAVEISVKNLLPKAQSMDALVGQLAETAAQERALLADCGDFLSMAATLEIEERSLSTHLVQLQHEKNRLSTPGSIVSGMLASDSVF